MCRDARGEGAHDETPKKEQERGGGEKLDGQEAGGGGETLEHAPGLAPIFHTTHSRIDDQSSPKGTKETLGATRGFKRHPDNRSHWPAKPPPPPLLHAQSSVSCVCRAFQTKNSGRPLSRFARLGYSRGLPPKTPPRGQPTGAAAAAAAESGGKRQTSRKETPGPTPARPNPLLDRQGERAARRDTLGSLQNVLPPFCGGGISRITRTRTHTHPLFGK